MSATEPRVKATIARAEVCECEGSCKCDGEPVASISSPEEREARRWAWWLTIGTITWNTLEAAIAIGGGILAGSIALLGFGLDSVVEVSSAVVIAWRLWRQTTDHHANERAERRAVRLIALSFFGIAAYVSADSVAALLAALKQA